MKAKYFLIMVFFCVLNFSILAESEWSEPINISNSETGWDRRPRIAIDNTGKLHCVWLNTDSVIRKVFYSFSNNQGESWSEPFQITNNETFALGAPSIDIDSDNNIYVIYPYGTSNPSIAHIRMQKYDGESWSDPINVTEGQPGAGYYDNNKMIIDNNDRIYFFWYLGTVYYRYYENGEFSEITQIHNDLPLYSTLVSIKIDNNGNLHGTGKTFENKQVLPVYYKYNGISWFAPEIVYPRPGTEGIGQDIFPKEKIHIVIRDGNNEHDGTTYKYKANNEWSIPNLINEDPLDQRILVDKNNKLHIMEWEKNDQNGQLVYYTKKEDVWEGTITVSGAYVYGDTGFNLDNKYIYLLYAQGEWENIYFTRKALSDSTDIIPHINSLDYKLSQNYPNPCNPNTTINFSLNKSGNITLKILNVKGQLVRTLVKNYRKKGEYAIQWDGKDAKGREVASGVYYYRLQVDNKVRTRSLTLIK